MDSDQITQDKEIGLWRSPAVELWPPANERSTLVKGRPVWLNETDCPRARKHVVPVFSRWASRILRRDFYRIGGGAKRFKCQLQEPLQTWLLELKKRIEVTHQDVRARSPMPQLQTFVTLEVFTHEAFSEMVLDLIIEADRALAWWLSQEDVEQMNQDVFVWLTEPFRWIKNRDATVGVSRYHVFYPGTHIAPRRGAPWPTGITRIV